MQQAQTFQTLFNCLHAVNLDLYTDCIKMF